ncbi:hypothetical protein I317_05004 [Kwoniella heveanensis CBS 569]|uniref:Protein YOP1 n=2 Tax=Kwoniella heveanensis TaxID=89924 RepID=A0A1B9H2U1_9TREE|nr:CND01620 [Kwoniella heveanensis]OCF37580.1 hypothetical protein I316_00706 [Kwoniella heveanensis BCC8398]OCF41174.1 hypothetical protein I317_05004 [Kwoniella heveanensis CBS 569]
MDPTTSAHVDPFAHPGSASGPGIAADLTSKQPTVSDTSGLQTSTVPSASTNAAFNNPFVSGSATLGGAPSSGGPAVTHSHTQHHTGAGAGAGLSTSSGPGTGSFHDDIQAKASELTTGASIPNPNDRDNINSTASHKRTGSTTNDTTGNTNTASGTIQQGQAKVQDAANHASNKASEAATGLRQRVRKLSVQLEGAGDHPAVKNAKGAANNQIAQIREQLGRSQTVRDLEKRTGVDRVVLVFGGIAAYLILIPFNLLRLALPLTQLLTILPATLLSAETLDRQDSKANDEKTKSLLAYFVVLGFIQTVESLMAGFLERRIPQYYTVKLLFLAYLLHPRTQGALKVNESVFRPLLARAQQAQSSASSSYSGSSTGSNTYGAKQFSSSSSSAYPSTANVQTPPTSKPSLSSASSPTQPQTAGFGNLAANIPLPGEDQNTVGGSSGFVGSGGALGAADNLTKNDARGQGFNVVSELH